MLIYYIQYKPSPSAQLCLIWIMIMQKKVYWLPIIECILVSHGMDLCPSLLISNINPFVFHCVNRVMTFMAKCKIKHCWNKSLIYWYFHKLDFKLDSIGSHDMLWVTSGLAGSHLDQMKVSTKVELRCSNTLEIRAQLSGLALDLLINEH